MRNGANMIGFDRPQRGHNILAHGSAVGVGGGMSFCVGVVWPPMSSRQSAATRDPTRAQNFEPLRRRVTPAGGKDAHTTKYRADTHVSPLRQDGIVGHGPTYGTMRNGANMIGFDRPQRGHNM